LANLVIGICGFKGSGKDTVGDFLVKNYRCLKDSYAAPLKDACSAIFSWDRNLLEGATKESREWREQVDHFWAERLNKPGFTPRLALQWMGTEAGRNVFGTDLWTGAMSKRVSLRTAAGLGTVITDVRFPNEIEHVLDMGGVVLEVSRGPNPAFYDIAHEYNGYIRAGKTIGLKLPAELDTTQGGTHESEWRWIGHPGMTQRICNDGSLHQLESAVHDLVASVAKTR
jgi:hypothetical protein